ncbi:hypothetical protein Tco_0466376 [Tanacetum coccineum]
MLRRERLMLSIHPSGNSMESGTLPGSPSFLGKLFKMDRRYNVHSFEVRSRQGSFGSSRPLQKFSLFLQVRGPSGGWTGCSNLVNQEGVHLVLLVHWGVSLIPRSIDSGLELGAGENRKLGFFLILRAFMSEISFSSAKQIRGRARKNKMRGSIEGEEKAMIDGIWTDTQDSSPSVFESLGFEGGGRMEKAFKLKSFFAIGTLGTPSIVEVCVLVGELTEYEHAVLLCQDTTELFDSGQIA